MAHEDLSRRGRASLQRFSRPLQPRPVVVVIDRVRAPEAGTSGTLDLPNEDGIHDEHAKGLPVPDDDRIISGATIDYRLSGPLMVSCRNREVTRTWPANPNG